MHDLPLQNLSSMSAGKPRSAAGPEHDARPLPGAPQVCPAVSQTWRRLSASVPSSKPAPPLGGGVVGAARARASFAAAARSCFAGVSESRSWQEMSLLLTPIVVAALPFEVSAVLDVSSCEQTKVRPSHSAVHVSALCPQPVDEFSSEIRISLGLQPICPAVTLSRDGRQASRPSAKHPRMKTFP